MQKILLHITKASYALFSACDSLLQDRTNCHDVLKLIVESLALLGLSILQINHFKRQLTKHRLLDHLKSLIKMYHLLKHIFLVMIRINTYY